MAVRGGADFADRVQDAGACLMVGGVDNRDVRVLCKDLFDCRDINRRFNRKLEVYVRQTISLAYLDCAGRIGAVVGDQHLFPAGRSEFRQMSMFSVPEPQKRTLV